VPQFEVLQLAGAGVGGERGQPVAVDVIESELGSGVGALTAHDDPHPGRPTRQIHDAGELGHVRAGADTARTVVGRCPYVVGDQLVEAGGVHREGEPDRVRHAAAYQRFYRLMGGAGPVDTDQDFAARARAEAGLVQCGSDHLLVIAGGVRSRVTGPQHDHQRLAGAAAAVVGECA